MTSSIKEISRRIASNPILIEEWLASKNIKAPSFEQDADENFPSTDGNAQIDAAQSAIIEDTNTLHDTFIGPGEVVRRICWGVSEL